MAALPPEKVEQDDDVEDTPGYKAPKQATVEELINKDQEDESLRKYKEQLGLKGSIITFPDDPRRCIVQKLQLCADGQPDKVLDLTGNLDEVKKTTFIIKEGCKYKIKIVFCVQREIVAGLKYVQRSFRKGIQVDKTHHMVGSYAPQVEPHVFTTKEDEAPSGMLARGTYTIKSLFTDDDKFEHLKWEWHLEIKKDWQ